MNWKMLSARGLGSALLAYAILSPTAAAGQWLRVSPNPHLLQRDDGTPFFFLADTAWEIFLRLDRSQADYYLRNRAGKGFTVVQATLISELNGPTTKNAEGELPMFDMDPTRPNEKYFAFVDHVVDRAAEDGIYMALLPTWASWVEDRPNGILENHKIFTPANAYQYGLYLGKRYAKRWNIIWVLGGDRSPVGHEDVWDAMTKGLREGDGGRHLMTYHPPGFKSSSQFFPASAWLDFNMIQVSHNRFDNIDAEFIAHDYALMPTKPVIDAETTYEDHPVNFWIGNPKFDAYDVRKAAYWAVFAGAAGHTYGHNSVWQMYRVGDAPMMDAKKPWIEALDAEGASEMGHLRALIESRPYFDRIPDQSLILPDANAIGHDSDRIQITRDGTPGKNDATYILAYLPIVRDCHLNTRVMTAKQLRAWWFDPRTGNAFPLGTIENQGDYLPARADRPNGAQGGPDWVLVVDDAAKLYGAPGGRAWPNISLGGTQLAPARLPGRPSGASR